MKLLTVYTILILLATFIAGFKVFKNQGTPFDIKVRDYFTENRTPLIFKFMGQVTRLGNVETLFVIILPIVFILIRDQDFITATAIVTSAGLAAVLSHGLKFAFRRKRPVKGKSINSIGYSFPSGHSCIGVGFYLTLAYISTYNLGIFPLVMVLTTLLGLTIAFSRVYIGVHWVSDVAFGIMLGFACAGWSIYLFNNGYILEPVFKYFIH